MANFYVSSVAYTAVTQWSATTAFATGAIVRQLLAPATNAERCFRVTAGGGGNSGGGEPTWVLTSNGTTTDGALTWTECTGQEAHQHDNGATTTWTAPAARFNCLTAQTNGKNVIAAGDTIYLSSDHAETQATTLTLGVLGTVASPGRGISVRKTGSVPPVSADLLVGASIACTANNFFTQTGSRQFYWYGVTFDASANTTGAGPCCGSNDNRFYEMMESCTVKTTNTSSSSLFAQILSHAHWKNVTLSLTHASSQLTQTTSAALVWRGGSTTGSGTNAFWMGNAPSIYCDGVDFSTITTTLMQPAGSAAFGTIRFYGCKLGSTSIVFNQGDGPGLTNNTVFAAEYWANNDADQIQGEFIDCDTGNNAYSHHWYKWAGYVQTETTITRTGGATDGTQKASRKMVTNNNASPIWPLRHDLYVYNSKTGSSVTATVEIISSATLNNNDIWAEVYYLGESGSGKIDFLDDYLADPLAAAAAQTSSTASWDSSPATPQKQKLTVNFTAQKAGILRFRVCLGKLATTCYVDHLVTLT